MKNFILLILLTFFATALNADDITPIKEGNKISGHVIEHGSEESIAFASVLIVETGVGTMSNEQGEPMFCAKDDAMRKARNAIAQHVDKDDALKQGLIDSMGRKQQATFINESSLYALILSSNPESAIRFKHWVTS